MLSIDRFEGLYAVCVDDDGHIVNVQRSKIKGEAVEGDVIQEKNGFYAVLKNETQIRKEEIKKLQDELFQ